MKLRTLSRVELLEMINHTRQVVRNRNEEINTGRDVNGVQNTPDDIAILKRNRDEYVVALRQYERECLRRGIPIPIP